MNIKNQSNISGSTDFDDGPILIYHSLKGAIGFGTMVVVFSIATIATFFYLLNTTQDFDSIPIPLILLFSGLFLILFQIVKGLFKYAGKVAITLGPEGVKFDRYSLIQWRDIEDIYVVEDIDGPSSLWLRVKEGVNFLPDGPRPILWLAKKSNLHRCIDISGYGSFTLSDKQIHTLLEDGMQYFRE